MAFKFGKKGKNQGAVDSWLDSLGYYRKNIAYDETCLFRAVSEQLYFSQMYHERIRKECIDYAKDNFHRFTDLVRNELEWYDHLQKLKIHMVVCDNIEIQIISKLYKRDVLVFDGLRLRVQDVTNNKYSGTLLLCKTNEDHYDVVYKREYIMTAGFCQSVVYSILYENVFKIDNVSAIVNSMLYDKNALTFALNNAECPSEKNKLQNRCSPDNDFKRDFDSGDNDEVKGDKSPSDLLLAPFPFKVAKALDPTIYRNIEYDTWIEVRRELRLGEWYNGDNKLILGTRCILRLNDQDLSCYIQEHIKNEDKCVVYVTSLAEFRTVLFSDLRAEDDAKPWPLPYRFSRNNVIMYSTPLQLPSKEHKIVKRRKEKKRNKSLSESSTQSGIAVSNTSENASEINVSAYEGCPLQMKEDHVKETHIVDNSNPSSQMEHTMVQQEPEVQWMNEWGPITYTAEPTMWPQSPNNPQSPTHSYGYKPVVPVFTYPETPQNIQYYYNYPVERYSSWPTPEAMPSDVNYIPCENPPDEIQTTPDSYSTSPKYYYYTTPQSPCERTIVTAPITPTSPHPQQVDYYPVMYPPPSPHPGTPIYYIPPPPSTPKVTDLVIPMAPVSVYTPPADVQYMSPTPFVFPSPRTPQPTWYQPNVNSQGFIFPTPISPAPQGIAK